MKGRLALSCLFLVPVLFLASFRTDAAAGYHLNDPTIARKLNITVQELKSLREKFELENDQVRVMRARYGPHDKGVMHEHSLNRVVTYVTAGNMKITTPGGEFRTATNSPGDVTWGVQAKHIEENLNDTPFEVVVVEFKK